MYKKKFSLISVYDKNNLEKICNLFKKNNIKIISTGATAKHIKKIGHHCYDLSYFTKFKEILDGRVKTLHPLVHASLLFDRKNNNHSKLFKTFNFPEINYVIVNLYPFKKYTTSSSNNKKIIEMIDIGGLTLLRSAAKNFESVTPISNIEDYNSFIKNFNKNSGKTSLYFRKKMAAKIFKLTSEYDNNISNWIKKQKSSLSVANHKKLALRYGENPHQKSFFYKNNLNNSLFDKFIQQNKKLSFNNILDIDSAYECVSEFQEPTCVIIKHNIPCGAASDTKIERAFLKAYDSDSISAFGGIVAFNRTINQKISKNIISKFFEIIIAPSFSKGAIKVLKNKKRLTIIETKNVSKENKLEIKSVNGGYLFQEKNSVSFTKQKMKCVSNKKASNSQINDLVFAFKISKYIKSNAIVLVKNKQTLGIGSGQTSRIDSVKIALSKKKSKLKKNGFVAASDAYFPFTDTVNLLINKNCKAILQPNGSINDEKIINFANLKKIPLYFTNYRFFKH